MRNLETSKRNATAGVPLLAQILWFATLISLCCIPAAQVFAQGASSSLTGQITDSTGAAIPAATVTVTNLGTNLSQSTTTGGEGVYRIAPLPPGNYSMSVEAKGFVRYVQSGIVLTVALSATQNVTLKPGSAQQTINVTADAELLNTTSPALGMTVNAESVTQLPLNGRDPSTLVFLAPGMTNALNSNGYLQGGFSFPEETGAAANGGRQGSTYYLLNGVPNMDTYLGLAAPFPNADATQEFRVITNNFSAAYGFAPGAVVSIETKSGSNSYHGGAFEFYRNQNLNAANWFSHSVDPLHRNQFGGYVGGPVIKDKVFFFLNYQGTRSSSASTANSSYTYTPAMLNGDFSGVPQTLFAPFTTIGGKPNQINPALFNPTSVTIAQTALPQGQQPSGLTYYKTGSTIQQFDEGTARLDFNISPSQRISISSYINDLIQPAGDIPGNILSILNLNNWSMVLGEQMQYYNEALNHTWTINPHAVNVASVFWTQMSAHNAATALTSNNQPFCWSKYINVTELPGSCYVEGFSVGGNGFSVGYYEPSQEVRTTYGLYDNFTMTKNKHVLQFGADIQHQYAEEFTQYPTQPILDFSGQYTNSGLADFLLGDLSSMTQGAGEVADVAGWQPGIYGQDEYRMRPNLVLTAGLRWDPNFPPQIASGRAATFVPGQQSTVYPNAPVGLVFPGDHGIGNGLMSTTYGYWEPRIGVAWQPAALPRTAVHAGFGLFTSPLIYSMYNHTADNAPFAPTFSLNGTGTTPLSMQNPWSGFAGTGGASPFPPFASSTYRPPSSATFTPGLSIPATFAPNFRLGVTQSWNVSVEQGIGWNTVFRIAYVGSQSYHQAVILDKNPGIYATNNTRSTYPAFGEILDDQSLGTSSYNGLQLTVEHHLSHGLQFQSNLTWNKTIDTASSANISFGANQLGDPFDLSWSRGISSQNFPFVWITNFIYTTPKLRNQNQFIQQTLGGWEVSAIITSQSGSPFGVSAGLDGSNNSGANQYEDRADRVQGAPLQVRQGGRSNWLNHYFNIDAFRVNAPGTFGDSGKNLMVGPPVNFTDAGLYKNWSIAEKLNLQFRWEMFNAFNHPNFGTPNASNQFTDTGSNQGGTEGEITGLGWEPPRVMQGAIKIIF